MVTHPFLSISPKLFPYSLQSIPVLFDPKKTFIYNPKKTANLNKSGCKQTKQKKLLF